VPGRVSANAEDLTGYFGLTTIPTGDLGQLDADGSLVFLGRAGRQVKILGYRVELAHVEFELRALDG
jgi:non-ribosomal peptide synthetase component F